MSTQTTTRGRVEAADILKAAAALGVLGGAAQAGRRLLAMLCNPAVTAGEVAAAIDREPGMASEAFIAGLRHDNGVLVQIRIDPP